MSQTIPEILNIGSGTTPDIVLSDTSGINTVFNANKQNIDFSVLGTGNGGLFFDASAGRVGIGTGVPDAVLHVVAPCSKDGLIIESVTNCPTGVTLLLVHNPQTPPQSGSYPAIINLAGRDTNYGEISYGQIMSKVLDPITGYTSGEIIFTVDDKGTNRPVFSANLQNTVLGGNNSVSGYAYTVLGGNNAITGVRLINIGTYNSGLSDAGLIVGGFNNISGSQIIALVNNANLKGNNNLSLGDTVSVSGLSNIFIGNTNALSGSYNILLGSNNGFVSSSAVGLTQLSYSTGVSGVVLGTNTANSGHNNIYIGNLNNLVGHSNNVVGSTVSVTGSQNSIYGNSNNLAGSELISIGSNQSLDAVSSGIFIGNDIQLSDSNKTLVVGMGNINTNDGLVESILVGINNNLTLGTPDKLLLIGQNNVVNNITGSLIVGNTNSLSGTVNNNLVLGSTNAVPPVSTNNLIFGVLNNQTGVYIDSVGGISGTPRRTTGTIINSVVAGINNVIQSGNSNVVIGNKNTVAGSNTNTLGSYNNLKKASDIYSIGNSNFLVGDKIGTVGSKISVVGSESVVFNTADKKMDVFGSGNIVIGYNQMVSSGIAIGTTNRLDGVNNIVYGRDNTIGSTRNQCLVTDPAGIIITIPTAGILSKYIEGDKVLICIQNPPSVANTFVREIAAIVENSIDNTTTITLTVPINIDATNGYYNINNAFDDNNIASTMTSGLIMPYQRMGGEGGPEINPVYGSHNIVVGSKNTYMYNSGIVLGYNNNISGIRNIAIGYGLSGVVDDTLYIGTNNSNKVILDNTKVVFNSGRLQQNFIVKSASDSTSIINSDLNNNRVGINTDNPTSDLSVSGLLTTTDFKLGFSAPDAFVLTTNTNGVGTWQLPVRLSGTNGGMLFKITDKGASGISDIVYNTGNKQLAFNLGGNNELYINSSGLFINDDAATYQVRIRGSGGVDFARTLFETDYAKHRINFFNISGNSGNLNGLTLSSGLNLPVSLTGSFLYVNNSGKLDSFITRPHSIIFSNENSYSTGNASIRWINPQQTLALGATGTVQYDLLSTNTPDSFYNILLSSNSQIDTVFNNRGLGNRFSVINSGALNSRIGFHITPTGSVAINTSVTALPDYSEAALYVNGKAWVTSLKVGNNAAPSGYYLRTDQFGNIRFSNLDLNTQFIGFSSDQATNSYPINIISTSQGIDGSFITNISFTQKKSNGSALSSTDDGTYVVWRGDSWINSSGLKVYQNQTIANDPQSVRGIEFGYKALATQTRHNHASAGGSFKITDERYDGSSQNVQYYLRTRTTDAVARPLVTNWTKNATVSSETQSNCINLNAFSDNTNYEYDRVWSYQISVSVLWQVGSSSVPNANGTRSAGTYYIEGALFRSAGGTRFDKLGAENIRYYGDTMPNGMGIGTQIVESNPPRLTIMATGINGFTALWSATARVNQINHPGADTLYGS